MSKFNLNDDFGGGVAVFNGGQAGKVENVKIDVAKKRADEPDHYPDYRLIVTDDSGGQPLTMGFKREEEDEARQIQNIQRIKDIARAVVPDDFQYPAVDSYTEAVDSLFKIIKEHSVDKKVNVFTTYGYEKKPSKYLGLRYFNFIEKPGSSFSRLKPQKGDVMERIMEDTPQTEGNNSTKEVDWI